jgi:hypothetical protein
METNTNFSDVVSALKRRIRPGDATEICARVGLTPLTYRRACKCKNWDELTKGELTTIKAAILYFEEQDAIIKKAENL